MNRERFGPLEEGKRVEKSLKYIQKCDEVREIHVPKCAKCSGSVAPRRSVPPEGMPHGLSLDAMASHKASCWGLDEPETENGVVLT